jgi:hypothetical protein
MPIKYHFRHDERLVIVVHVGAVSNDEFFSFYKAIYEDTRFDKSFNLLIDLRQTESSVRSTVALTKLADFMRTQFLGTTARPKVAVVAPKDISFGLARMYEVFSGDVPWEFVVFRAIDTALGWIGLSENVMNDIDQDAEAEDSPDFE